ncbi:MAG: type VI secretion system-associated FHA domain protein [Myxococcota bacterium]
MSVALTAHVLDSQTNQSFDVTYERFPVRIGRNQLNDLHIDRAYVSQFHAAIEVNGGQIWVKDLGSTNGTAHRGQRLQRDHAVDVSSAPEINIGPLVIRLAVKESPGAVSAHTQSRASFLDIGTPAGADLMERRRRRVPPGAEDPFVRQLVPYIESWRQQWANVYRLAYEHLARLQPEVASAYLKRLILEHPELVQEADFQRVAAYYGVSPHEWGEIGLQSAALGALTELSRQLAPDASPPDDPLDVIAFARRIRDAMEVFLKGFVSLRDGHHEFEAEVLRKERLAAPGQGVGAAKDHVALGRVLFGPETKGETPPTHQLHEIFVEVMTHQVALLNGVMEGVKQLLTTLSPGAIEKAYDQKGKKAGLFSNKYEGLWETYQTVHGDYQGEDKETFLIIFGPQFSRAYAATTGEAHQASTDGTGTSGRLSTMAHPTRR